METRSINKHRKYEREMLVKAIRKYAKEGDKILDIGSADGSLAKQLKGFDVTSIDPHPKSKEVQQGSVYYLPFPNCSFDIVILECVYEHLDKPLEALAEIKRILVFNKWLFLVTPNRLWYRTFLKLKGKDVPIKGHVHEVSKAECLAELKSMEFGIAQTIKLNYYTKNMFPIEFIYIAQNRVPSRPF